MKIEKHSEASAVEFGLDTFGDVTVDADGRAAAVRPGHPQRGRGGRAGRSVGVDFFGIGEHHRDDFAVSAPEIVLAAIAARTERIRLGTAVTVLSSDDPVRVFERFATLDAVSNGRAEIILGRGSFTESFPLFGFDLRDYEKLFEEKIDLLSQLLKEDAVTWQGSIRPPLPTSRCIRRRRPGRSAPGSASAAAPSRSCAPPTTACRSCWPSSAVQPERFTPFVELYQRALEQMGQDTTLPVAVHSPGFIAATDAEAADLLWPHHKEMVDRIGAERGWPPTNSRALRGGDRHRRAPRRIARDRRAEDRQDGARPRHPALRPEVLDRRDAARAPDDGDRAVRHAGHPARPRAAREEPAQEPPARS